ncbi:hypothetical protein DIPPA_31324 [Diplonema papillatum]|nr:hypothetical protein DIPPA_31324 [Diplonema papillatum]KAJ9457066.1 hypothetical protein DIPPA_31324 [Diplonema papillatum]
MDLLQRLKKATDIGSLVVEDEALSGPGEIQWDATTSRGELEALLRRSQLELQSTQSMYNDLKSECVTLREQHGGYRAKVQAWRKQSQVDRDSAKKMIMELRGCDDAAKEDSYAAALEAQIATLKESFQQVTERAELLEHEKKMIEHKWQQDFKEYNSKVEAWKAGLENRRKPGTESPAAIAGEEAGATDADTALLLIQKDQELESVKKLLEQAEAGVKATEARSEELAAKSAEGVRQIQDLIAKHERELRAVQAEGDAKLAKLQSGTHEKYVKGLEAELDRWRGTAGAVNTSDFTNDDSALTENEPVHGTPPRPSIDSAGPSTAQRPNTPRTPTPSEFLSAQRLQQDLDTTSAELRRLREQYDTIRSKTSTLGTDAAEREIALQELFEENKRLREAARDKEEEVAAASRLAAEKDKTVEDAEEERAVLSERLSEAEAATAKAHRSAANLQKEIGAKNETIRKLRAEAVKKYEDARPAEEAAGRKAFSPLKGRASTPPETGSVTYLGSWRRMRVPLALVFIFVFLFITAMGGRTINVETELSDKLLQCVQQSKEQARALEEAKRAIGGS